MAVSDSYRFWACNFMKQKTATKMFSCQFYKILKKIFSQNTCGWLLLVFICEFWEVFQNISFIPVGNCLFHEQVAEFQPAVTVKNYFIGDFQAFYIRMRSNYSKAFIYLK